MCLPHGGKRPVCFLCAPELLRMYHVTWPTVCEQVCGSHGVIQANNPVDTAVTRVTAAGVTTDPLQYSFPQRYAQAYAAEVNHLVDCILGKACGLV